jgi:branched-chain amino acid transport system substrate-binding protein
MVVAKVGPGRRLRPAWSRAIGIGAALTALVAGLAACGASSGSASGGGSVKLGVMYPPSIYPEVLAGAKAGVAKLNDEGGIGGRKVELDVCEIKAFGNEAESNGCARKFIDDGVVADIGSFGIAPATYALYEQANIPAIGNFVSDTSLGKGLHAGFTSKVSFPLTGGATPLLVSVGQLARNQGYKSFVGFQVEGASSMASDEAGYGQKLARVVEFPLDATDMSSYAATAMEAKPDAITLAGPSVQLLQVYQALSNLGFKGAVVANCVSVSDQVLQQIPGLLCTSQSQLPSNTDEKVQDAAKRIREADAKAPLNELSGSAYAAALAVKDALKDASGKVTGSDVLAGLDGLTIDNGITPPLTFGKPLATASPKGATRLFTDGVVYYQSENGQLVPLDGNATFVSASTGD